MRAAICCLLLTAAMGVGKAATIQLYQGGWDVGGPLVITFTGEDSNGNSGYDTAELTSFSAIFQLPGGGQATFSLADLGADGFFYGSPADYFIKADSPDFSLYEIADASGSTGIATDAVQSFFGLTGDPLQPVPEPATLSLLAASMGILLAARRWGS